MTRRTTRRPVLRSNQLAYVRSGVEQECGGGAVHLGIEQDHVVDAVEGDGEGAMPIAVVFSIAVIWTGGKALLLCRYDASREQQCARAQYVPNSRI